MSTRNLICPLFQWSSRAPDQPVIWLASRPLTAGALEHQVRRILARLQQEGVGSGDRIGIWLDDPVATIACMLALWRLQAVACLLSTRTPPGGLTTFIQQVGLQALITNRPVQTALPCWSPEMLQAGASVMGADIPRLALEQEATIFFTSGSTGAPKGVLHTLRNHFYSARGVAQHVQLRAGDRWLLVLPLYHVGGMGVVIRCLLVGAAVMIPERQEPLGQALMRYDPTHVSLVYTQLWRLLRNFRDAPPRALRVVLLGGSAISEDVLQEGIARRWPLLTSYGLTEMASTVTATPPGASLALLRTSGQVLPYRALKIGPDGSIRVRGLVRFAGYLENGQLRRPFEEGGWFDTGDLGWVDEKGLLHVEGRRDNRFISGGENIQPEAIERVLQRLPGVAEAIVVPVPDPEFGERPAAFVRLSGSAPWTPKRWRTQLRQELPGFMVPVAFWRWPEGVEAGFKIARRQLQEEARRRWQSPGKVHLA